MTQRTVGRLAWAIWGVTLLAMVGFEILGALAGVNDALDSWLLPAVEIGFATVGALIVSRKKDNTIGWISSWIGAVSAVSLFAGVYAAYGIETRPGAVPLTAIASWVAYTGFALVIVPIAFIFLLFPDGRVPTRRWRPVLWVMVAAAVVVILGFPLAPGPLSGGFQETHTKTVNPFGLPGVPRGVVTAVTEIAGWVVFAGGLLSVVSLALRYRRSRGEERQQIRWLAYVGGIGVAALLAGLLAGLIRLAFGIEAPEDDLIGNVVFFVVILDLTIGIPAASAIAILRYRLFDLDVVVKKTVVFGLLVGVISLMYVVIVLAIPVLVRGAGRGSVDLVSLVAALAAALAFNPVRAWARRLADRFVYGRRAKPYDVLADFSEHVAGTYSTDDVLPRMAQILGGATGADTARVWLRVGGELRPAASWPGEVPPVSALRGMADRLPPFPEGEHAFEVRHQGELLGALSVAMPANDPIDASRERLVRDLAAQAGLVLRNVRLIEELRASRQRLVAAQDEERRRIERNIHDGAQQQLVALSVKLRLARGLASKDIAKTEAMLGELEGETAQALDDLRDLARGIYPPLLADKGLTAALDAQARRAVAPISVDTDGIGRYPPQVEAAVYFCCLEALQNVAKYANAHEVTVRLEQRDDTLTFDVTDDGSGFDPGGTPQGTGLQGMADRLDAIGGTLEVRSAPGRGTSILGQVPVRLSEPGG